MRIFQKRSVILAVVIFTVFLLAAFSATGKVYFPVAERVVAVVISPFESGLAKAGFQLRSAVGFVKDIFYVHENNRQLKHENEQFKRQLLQMTELLAENARLKTALAYRQAMPQFDFVLADVIGRDAGSWASTIMINRGSNDGINKDMPVVTSQGLVGNVVKVFPYSAQVSLLTDTKGAVGSMVQRPESRVVGIVEGAALPVLAPRMINLSRDADVIKGDRIISSGLGGIYPKGLMIGEVTDIVNVEGGLLKEAVLKPAVDFDRLEEVYVLVRSREAISPTANSGGRR